MNIKQIRIIKIIRGILLSAYLYFMWNQTQLNNEFRLSYLIISTIIFFCGISLGTIIPKDYQVGNTFFNPKSKWLEAILEIIIVFGLAAVFSLF